jgi:hypothetical protein
VTKERDDVRERIQNKSGEDGAWIKGRCVCVRVNRRMEECFSWHEPPNVNVTG